MPKKDPIHPEVRKFQAEIGRRGGSAKGACKVRGDSEYYRGLRAIRKAKEEASK